MEMFYSRELGLKVPKCPTKTTNINYSLSDALALYQRLKGNGKTKLSKLQNLLPARKKPTAADSACDR